jgi:hypothetical protein
MSLPTEISGPTQYVLNAQFKELVCDALRRSHKLSKHLHGWQQEEEFQNRADLVSVLVLSGAARPNGVHPNGKIGLDIACAYPFMVHQYPHRLHPAARARLENEVAGLPVKCSLREQLEAKTQDGEFSKLRLPAKKRRTE